MPSFLQDVLSRTRPTTKAGKIHNITWQWLGEGVVSITPATYDKSVVISAGIHGNETAPIEMLEQIYQDIFAGELTVNSRLLLILGNPEAIRQNKRFIGFDMNRLFYQSYQPNKTSLTSQEALRAKLLEQWVGEFFATVDKRLPRYHYDLHTAIRSSLLPTFALFPYPATAADDFLLGSLAAAELDALVYHNTTGGTFTQFSCSAHQAFSATLELGKAKPFGQNDLRQFASIDRVLRAIISGQALPARQTAAIRVFDVSDSIIKQSDEFVLYVEPTAPNFTAFEAGTPLATDGGQTYIMHDGTAYILFPNPNVAKGLRAGLVLKERMAV